MTRYTDSIRNLLIWQLVLPVIMLLSLFKPLAILATCIIFFRLLKNHDWERNSYSVGGAVAVVLTSLALGLNCFIGSAQGLAYFLLLAWVMSMIAFTSTSPYPLAIRMPVIVYTVLWLLVWHDTGNVLIPLGLSILFAGAMMAVAYSWKRKSATTETPDKGPAEPPYSFSLSAAIICTVALATIQGICRIFWTSSLIPRFVVLCCLIMLCVWLLSSSDWKKNKLAVGALVVMICAHTVAGVACFINNPTLYTIAFYLGISPVMFHTTAPVFRGMRVTITLYAVYASVCKPTTYHLLNIAAPTPLQDTLTLTVFDCMICLALMIMNIYWAATKYPVFKSDREIVD